MRAIVYGAGVLGCELTHCLAENPDVEVTVLARGAWADTLERSGLRIHHSVQKKDTVDHPHVIRSLKPGDAYDLVFVVLQSSQVGAVLPALAANVSERFVFVGNQPDAPGIEHQLAESSSRHKECAFVFFSCGGRREDGQVIAAHLKHKLTVGGSDRPLPVAFSDALARATTNTQIEIAPEDHMDGWLKWHAACILPMAYLAYARGCDLTRSTSLDRKLYLDACAELAQIFHTRNIPIRPKGDEDYFIGGPKRAYLAAFYYVVFKTFLGRLCVTDHCQHAVGEMHFMAASLEQTLNLATHPDSAPSYFKLKAMMPSWEELEADPCTGGSAR